jgi:hypothetical protein
MEFSGGTGGTFERRTDCREMRIANSRARQTVPGITSKRQFVIKALRYLRVSEGVENLLR